MLGFRRRRDADVSGDPTINLRYANEWVGGLVLVAIGVFIFAVIQAGVLREWLTPSGRLHFQLPQSGIAGLAAGNDVELMGTRIGTIREVKINDHGNMYAIATIDPQFEPFIRDDSKAIIKRRFVVAGASYIELTRGQGAPLDWAFAAVQAEAEQNPGDLIIKTVNDVRAQLVPTIQSAEKMVTDLATVTTALKDGQGLAGGLIMDHKLLARADGMTRDLQQIIAQLRPLGKQVDAIMKQTNGAVSNVNHITDGLKRSTPQIRSTITNVDQASAALPALLTQAQMTADSLRKLSDQLRQSWLLGGGSAAPQNDLPVGEISP